ncbi:hypothetical protein [Runella sp.]|uniref:hypothetical protein n=1 Tax=Runella sp. TaxID=1960881 RepID=UPI00301A7762
MTAIETYIRQHRSLFWSVSDDKLSDISDVLLVETILNYGTLEDVRELIKIKGLKSVAATFYKTTVSRNRNNYFPEVANFFNLYFKRHVPGNPV